jgi:hypothetical protein
MMRDIWDDVLTAIGFGAIVVAIGASLGVALLHKSTPQLANSEVFRVSTATSRGSAFSFSYKGHRGALTAGHVCDDASTTGYILDDAGVHYTILRRHPVVDMCLLEYEGSVKYSIEKGRMITLGDAADAYGYPYAVGPYKSRGLLLDVSPFMIFGVPFGPAKISFTNSINPGNSGGPLVQNGQPIGIVIELNTETRVGYAVPIQHVIMMLDKYWGLTP